MGGTSDVLGTLSRRDGRALRALLIAAVAAAGRPGGGAGLDQLVATAPMGALPPAAELHRVTGTVLRGLGDVAGVPDDVRTALESRRVTASLQHLLIAGALSEAGKAFDAAGVHWVVMKGPVVAGLLYPNASDRSYGDLDLLVPRRDFPTAMAILEEQGYRSTVRNWALAEQMLAGQIGMKGPAVHIDLHWELHYSRDDRRSFEFSPEDMVARSRVVDAAGVRAPTLDPEDTLITLAFHAARSDGHRLLWLKDVERALAIDRPDLGEVVRRAEAYRCAPPVGLILSRTRQLLGAPVPGEVVAALTPAPLRAAEAVTARLVHPVQLHEHDTVTRWLTRSVRSSVGASVVETPGRLTRHVARKVRPPRPNETDSADEKARYLDAVANRPAGPAPA